MDNFSSLKQIGSFDIQKSQSPFFTPSQDALHNIKSHISIVPHERTANGIIAQMCVYNEPLGGTFASNKAKEGIYIAEIAKVSPFYAAKLLAFHDDKLHVAEQALVQYRKQVDAIVIKKEESFKRENQEVDKMLELLHLDKMSIIRPLEEELDHHDINVDACRASAATACGAVGVQLDKTTTEHDLLQVLPISRDQAAQQLNLAVDTAPHKFTVVGKALYSLLIGSMLGLSLGIFAGYINPDNVDLNPIVVLAVVAGIAMSYFASKLAKDSFADFATSVYKQAPLPARVAKFILAASLLVLIATIYAVVDSKGVLKLAVLDGIKLSEAAGLCVGAVISLPYLLAYAYDGYKEANRIQTDSRITALQDSILEERTAARIADPYVQKAIELLAQFRRAETYRDITKAKIESAYVDLYGQQCHIEQYRPEKPEPTEHQLHCLHDAYMQYVGTQKEYERLKQRIENQLFPPLPELNDSQAENEPGLFAKLIKAITKFFNRNAEKPTTQAITP